MTVGMLVAGLAVPLAFGRLPGDDTAATSSVQTLPGATGDAPVGAGTGGVPVAPGATALPGGQSLPTGPVAGGSVGSTGTTTGAARPGAAQAPGTATTTLRATDQGVTPTTIKLGVVLLDIRSLEPVGFAQPHFTPDEQRQQYQVFIDEVNKAGGINGRRIAPVYRTYNALDTNGAQSGLAICSQLAQDEKVFAAVGVLGGGAESCLTQQHGIPSINNTASIDETYRKSKNLLVTPYASFERGTKNWGDAVTRAGYVKGRKSATLFGDVPVESRPEQALVDAMKTNGHTVTYRAKLTGDPASAQSQMPIEVQKMRQAGVDTVFLVTNFVTAIQFVQTADKQGYRPQYMVSDLGSLTAEGLLQRMPASFSGAIAVTAGRYPTPEPAPNKSCRDLFNAKTGNRYPAGNESGGTYLFCFMIRVFNLAGQAAGPELTRRGLATAFQNLGSPSLSVAEGSFRPGKTDFGDYFRFMRFDGACKCYKPLGPSQRGRY